MQSNLLIRLFKILNIIDQGPATIETIQKQLKHEGIICSSRTIYRDLSRLTDTFSLQNLQINVVEGEYNKKKWMLVKSKSDNLSLTAEQFFRLYFIDKSKPAWVGSLSGNLIDELLINNRRIESADASKLGMYLTNESVLNSNWGEYLFKKEYRDQIRDLFWAISNKRILIVKYYDHGKVVKKQFSPVRILKHRGAIHIIGWLETGKDYKLQVQELDSFIDFKTTDKRISKKNSGKLVDIELEKRFGIHDSVDDRIYKIRLQVSEGPALMLQNHHWHSSQKFKKNKDGTWNIALRCRINIELIGWICSWLEHMKVIEPLKLRNIVHKRMQYIVSMYKHDLNPINPSDTDNNSIVGM